MTEYEVKDLFKSIRALRNRRDSLKQKIASLSFPSEAIKTNADPIMTSGNLTEVSLISWLDRKTNLRKSLADVEKRLTIAYWESEDLLSLIERSNATNFVCAFDYYISGYTPDEIAEEYGLTIQSVMYHLRAACKHVAAAVTALEDAGDWTWTDYREVGKEA